MSRIAGSSNQMDEELVSALTSTIDEAATNVAHIFKSDRQRYGAYSDLPFEQAFSRARLVMKVVITSFETNSSAPLKQYLDQVFNTRLRTGYDPNAILRATDLIEKEFVKAACALKPGDEVFATALRRRMGFFSSVAKMYLATLNLTIPEDERNLIDPDLLRLS